MRELAGLIPLLPLAGAFVTALFFVTRRDNGTLAAMPVLLTTLTSVVLSCFTLGGLLHDGPSGEMQAWLAVGDFQLTVGYTIDALSVTMVLVVTFVAFLVQMFSIGYMRGDDGFARYFTYMGLFAAAMLGLVLADNLWLIYVCWELVGICSYLLIGFWYRNPAPANAAKKAFIVTRFGDLGLLGSVILLGGAAGTFELGALQERIAAGPIGVGWLAGGDFLTLCALLLFFGAMGKSAQFPLHVWLPDAMEGPTPVSALIHAATMVAAGVFLVARTYFLFAAAPGALDVVAWVGVITAVMGATIALVQYDIKRVMAYSTISQLGYMMLGLAVGGVTVGIFHLGTHAFFKALLFLTAGSVIHALHHRQDLREMGGLHSRMRITSFTCLVGALALAGIPPLSGFWSKDEILASALHASTLFYALGAAVAALTAFYMFRMWCLAFLGEPRTPAAEHARESPWVMTIPLTVLALVAIVVGAVNLPFGAWAHALMRFLEPGTTPHPFSSSAALPALALSLLGLVVGVVLYSRAPARDPVTRLPSPVYQFLVRKWYVDDFYERGVARVAVAWGVAVAWFDKYVVNGLVDFTAWLCGVGGGLLRLATSGQPQFYVAVLVLFAVLLAVWFRFGGGVVWVRAW
ncbi:MAG: NADH-quinone oxidoreductase subunit L [Fimbriimonadia bacterium]|jgi:NADH-quinone oxidoreductase subunit L